jgi:hypothetical protein
MLDKKNKGHCSSMPGERNPMSKLTNEQVEEIRTSNLKGCELAKKFGVRDAIISAIRLGQKWKHLLEEKK